MNAIQRLDQGEAIKAALEYVRQARQFYVYAMDELAAAGRPDLEQTLASSAGITGADAVILASYLAELEAEGQTTCSWCHNTYHLDHLRKHGQCPTCATSEA